MGWLIAAFAVLVAAGMTALASYSNRHVFRAEKAARERVRTRLAAREPIGTEELLDLLSPALRPAGEALLHGLSDLIGIEPGKLRPADRIGDLLKVNRSELSDDAQLEWDEAGFGDHLEVHCYDLMHLLERFSSRHGWAAQMKTLPVPPQKEEDWIDTFLGMTVAEFLAFFAPAWEQRLRESA